MIILLTIKMMLFHESVFVLPVVLVYLLEYWTQEQISIRLLLFLFLNVRDIFYSYNCICACNILFQNITIYFIYKTQ